MGIDAGDRPGCERRRPRALRPALEGLEGRRLPGTLATTGDVLSASGTATSTQMLSNATTATNSPPAPPAPPPAPSTSVTSSSTSASPSLASQGWSVANSEAAKGVTSRYLNLTFSKQSRDVALAYVDAVSRFNGKQLANLANTPYVKNLAGKFGQVGHSAAMANLGHQFDHFGDSVSREFRRIFG